MDLSIEEWLPVVGMEGVYEISNMGRFRTAARWAGRVRQRYFREPRILNGCCASGYWKVYFRKRWWRVHRLVLEAFRGPCPPGYYGCHINGNPLDNRLCNLRWDTPQSNQEDRVRHGTDNRGEKSATAKLTEAQVREILMFNESGKEAAEKYGVSRSIICEIRKRNTWRHVEVPESAKRNGG